MTPALELRSLKAVDRIQLVKALQSFEDINQQALTDHESESCKSLVYVNRYDMQPDEVPSD